MRALKPTRNGKDDSGNERVGVNPSQGTTVRRSFLTSSIFLRVAASVVFIPCVIVITNTGGYYFLLLINTVIFVGMWEFYRMMEAKGIRPYKMIGILCSLVLSWYVFFRNGMYANFFLTLVLLVLMCLELTRKETKMAIYHIAVTILGVIYIGFLGSHLIMLREFPLGLNLDYSMGGSFVLLAFILTWACDTGAYLVGSAIGKRKLIPRISGQKTREGSVGGFVFAVAAALVARETFAGYLELWHALALGAIAGVVGQLGDLFESMIKRDVDTKDTSEMIPGHGGVLDRFDSLLFTAPLIYYFIKFVVFK
ncbi:MAG: phosphatidate cytidylyltransferase [Candidatus Latescibacterota bacterium]|nr:MAG: phosphatidate cytidylyltransferase [Candidatus Latescibacterota bacterium]